MPRDGRDIKYLFEPRSVAVVGASHNPAKIGYKILQNIVEGGYEGRILPVNPKGGDILGLPVYTSLGELDGEIDLVVTAVPAKFALGTVKEAADIGAKFNLVITSGFSEIGNIAEERELTSYATERGMRIIGPNIFGMFSASAKLDANFGPGGIGAGSVAIITQSGALGLAMIGKTAVENMGISAMVSVGNKADIEEADLLEYLMHHDLTKVILMYIEGVGDGDRLVHTGSLAGSDDVFDAIMRQCGVLRAESIQEAFNLCKFLSTSSMPAGENVVIVTNGGGIGVLATDACEKYNVKLYDDNETLKSIFDSVTPDFGSTKNPIDLTGGATSPDFTGALNAALEHDKIDAVISLYCETAVFDADNLAPALATLTKKGVPVFGDVYETVACVGGLYRHWRNASAQPVGIDEEKIDEAAIARIIKAARADSRSFLLAEEGRDLMEAAGITMPETRVAKNLKDAVRFADEIGYPIVMKVVSRDILHKSDVGGVALDLENREEVMDAYEAIMSNCRARVPSARIKGIQVSEMAPSGVELIVGARKDPAFGPTIMFGMGGIYVEVLKDVTFRAVPFSRAEAIGMMKDIRAYPLLLGVRGEERKDIESVLDTIIRLGTVIQRCDGISDIEVNPLIAYEQGQGAKAVDIRVLLSKTNGGGDNA